MARADFGGSSADFVYTTTGSGIVRLTDAVLTMWDAEFGGTQVTDLLYDGAPTDTIYVTDGDVPTFQGPDGVVELWADAGGPRSQLVAVGSLVAQAEDAATAAGGSATAAAASAAAAAAVGTTNDTVIASRVNDSTSATRAAADSLYSRQMAAENAVQQGASPLGVTNSATAFRAVFDNAYATRVTDARVSSEKHVQRTVDIPAGIYVITSAEEFMPATATDRTKGLRFRGAGREATIIVFSPGVADQYLMRNQDAMHYMTFEHMTFVSTVSTASFLYSHSAGGAQNYSFDHVDWRGTWKYGINLQGSDTNSELTWTKCAILGDYTAFLRSDSGGTDQFLNYDFISCSVIMSTGNLVDMPKGGSINAIGGNFIHTGAGAASQTFFKVGSGTSSNGTPRLYVAGVRVEHRHILSKLIDCTWDHGTVHVSSVDGGSASSTTGASLAVTSKFTSTNGGIPSIVWDSCALIGKHEYVYTTAGSNFTKPAVYRSCRIHNSSTAAGFITSTNAGTNAGSIIAVEFDKCYQSTTSNGLDVEFDTVVNWQSAKRGQPKRRSVSIKNSFSQSIVQTTAETIKLPAGAIITRVLAAKPSSGASASTTWTYVLTNADATVVATLSAAGTTWSTAWERDSGALYYRCGTTNQRTLTLSATNITENSTALDVVIEYTT